MATEGAALPDDVRAAKSQPDDGANGEKKAVKRSWRRKYRKMRIQFDRTMELSNQLIRDEFRAINVARRLQEQNDQILELLLDLNSQPDLPAHLRFDLDPRPTDADPEARIATLRAAMLAGTITAESFAQQADTLRNTQPPLARSLATLEATVPHTTTPPDPLPEGLILDETAPGYMSPTHEEEYLLALDDALAHPSFDPNDHSGRPLRLASTRLAPTDKELSIQNPDSVYNWLRKHQPQVFLQDKDAHGPDGNASEKGAGGKGGRKGRQSNVHVGTPGPKGDAELDEDGIPVESAATAKGRKGKGDDDHAYRPKGGSGSRPSKRKREDGEGKGSRKKAAKGGAAANGGGS